MRSAGSQVVNDDDDGDEGEFALLLLLLLVRRPLRRCRRFVAPDESRARGTSGVAMVL